MLLEVNTGMLFEFESQIYAPMDEDFCNQRKEHVDLSTIDWNNEKIGVIILFVLTSEKHNEIIDYANDID